MLGCWGVVCSAPSSLLGSGHLRRVRPEIQAGAPGGARGSATGVATSAATRGTGQGRGRRASPAVAPSARPTPFLARGSPAAGCCPCPLRLPSHPDREGSVPAGPAFPCAGEELAVGR